MRLAFVLESPLRYGGGVSMVVRTLMEDMPDSFRFVLVSPDEEGRLKQDPLFGRIDAHISWKGEKGPPHPEFYRTRVEVLGRLIAAQPNLVHFHSSGVYSWGNRWPGASWPGYLAKKNIPCVWTNHLVVGLAQGYCGSNKPIWFKLAMFPFGYLGKSQQMSATSAEICVSKHDASVIQRWYFPFSKKVRQIYPSRLAAGEIAFSPRPREKIILSVGHLAYRKGQHILVQAFARICREHPDWKLVLVGPASDDGCAAWIMEFCRRERLDSRVTLPGSQEDAGAWMRRGSIFVQPSLQEALGLALQEAMACGCACVGTRVGGIPELIFDRVNGRMVDAGDISQLAQALRDLIKNEGLRALYGRAGVKHIGTLGMTRRAMVGAHEEVYKEIVSSDNV